MLADIPQVTPRRDRRGVSEPSMLADIPYGTAYSTTERSVWICAISR
jgi:hypothetical protein